MFDISRECSGTQEHVDTKSNMKPAKQILSKLYEQAGAELGQAQLKLGLDFNSINLNQSSLNVS